jgi:hypothetical protein
MWPLVVAAMIVSSSAAAQTVSQKAPLAGAGATAWSGNIRVSDETLVGLLGEGIKKSPTLRGLADRLTTSDVIVYVRPDVTARNGSQGRMTFLSANGGYRYLVIHVPGGPSKANQIAILGQELQHAVIVADAKSVVDSDSLLREFERIGKIEQSTNGRISFEGPTDIETRRRVLKEVSTDE